MTTRDYVADFEEFKRRQADQDQEAPGSKPTARFTFVSVDDLLAQDEERTPFIVDGLLPASGSSLLLAKPKTGKSTLAQQLAVCVAGGTPFLQRTVMQGPVLYLAFEEKAGEVRAHVAAMGVVPGLPIYLHFGACPERPLDALRVDVDRIKPALVIVDTLAYMVAIADIKDYSAVHGALKPYTQLARDTGAHLMFLHHAGKGSDERGTIDAALGSTALTGAVDTVIVMQVQEERRSIKTRQRYGQDLEQTTLTLDPGTRTMGVAGTVREQKRRNLEEEVLEAINCKPLSEKDLRLRIRCAANPLSTTLHDLVRDRHILKLGSGAKGIPYSYVAIQPDDDPFAHAAMHLDADETDPFPP